MKHPIPGRRLLTISVMVVAAGACTTEAPRVMADDAATFEAAYKSADAARMAAAEVGFEWRDTRKMLRRARKLAENGKYEQAIALANQAKRQGESGVVQAQVQETTWQSRVLK